MWENENAKGISSLEDLMGNVFPFWMENYFKNPSYLKVDGKPLLYVYRLDTLISDLGTVDNVKRAFDLMREECIRQGFSGLTIMCEHRFEDIEYLKGMVKAGFDYAFAYCWWLENHPDPEEAVEMQIQRMSKWKDLDIINFVPTVSVGWDPKPWDNSSKWHNSDEYSYTLTPKHFKLLCSRTKELMETLPENSLGRKLLTIDNWNEFGEGHYISPAAQYGFGYLDAIRDVFSDGAFDHKDIVPEECLVKEYEREK